MVLTLGNGQIWLGTSSRVLQFILIFFHFLVYNCLFAKNIRSNSDIGKTKECFRRYVVLKILFSSGNLSSLTCDSGSLSLLSNRSAPLVTNVPSKVRKSAEPLEHLRSENLILVHLQHSKFDFVYISHSPFETFHWLCVYIVVKLHAH